MPAQEEIEKLLAAPPMTYNEARGPWVYEDRMKPIRQFCEDCGYWGGLSVKGVEEGFALWSVCRFIRRSALLGMVHKNRVGNGEWRIWRCGFFKSGNALPA